MIWKSEWHIFGRRELVELSSLLGTDLGTSDYARRKDAQLNNSFII